MRMHIQENEQILAKELAAQPAQMAGVAEKFFATHGDESAAWDIDDDASEIAGGGDDESRRGARRGGAAERGEGGEPGGAQPVACTGAAHGR